MIGDYPVSGIIFLHNEVGVKLNVPPPPEPQPESAVPPPGPAPAAPPAGPKPATWPDWFGIADLGMIVFVGLATFLLGSFAARNTDIWLHLGIGRLVASGDFSFGKDTLSFTGADRYWVHHAWLTDLIAYQLFRTDPTGAALVAVKAGLFVVALGILVAIRRTGNALWPWAVIAALAALASAPHLQLRPIVASAPFLAATLYLLFRAEWRPGSWRNPILLGVLFGIWANVDSWFVLGPATVAVVLLGELLQTALFRNRTTGEAVPLGVPPVAGLVKALGVGIIACMLNPHHVHVWELPAELGVGFPVELANDGEFSNLTLSPFTPNYWDNSQRGYNVNGLCLVVLCLGSGAVLAAGFGRLRVAHLLLWIAFAYLAMRQVQLTMFFALVALPLAAGYLNALSSGVQLTTWANRGTRLVLTASGAGRLVCLPLGIAMVVCAWPGWLQPPTLAALVRRAEWKVDPDPGTVRCLQRVVEWRTEGILPAGVWGIAHSQSYGNYAAWFAPGEKAFVNSRFNFHRPELPEQYALRKALSTRGGDGEVDPNEVTRIVDAHKAGYLLVTSLLNQVPLTGANQMLDDEAGWRLWHVDGRSVVLGRVPTVGAAVAARLAFDPVKVAFAPIQPVLPEGRAEPPGPERTWLDEFKTGVKLPSVAIDDAGVLIQLADFYKFQSDVAQSRKFLAGGAAFGVVVAADLFAQGEITDAQRAIAVAQLRAARRAIADNPDAANGYYALLSAYQNPGLPELWNGERQMQVQTAIVRCLARIPPPESCTRDQAKLAFDLAGRLVNIYSRSRQLDYAQDAMKKVKAYFPLSQGIDLQLEVERARAQGESAQKQAEAKLKGISEAVTKEEQRLTDLLGEQIGKFEQFASKGTAMQKFQAAIQAGLPGRAIEEFKADIPGFGDAQAQAAFMVIELELASGRLEQAAQDFKELSDGLEDVLRRYPPQQGEEIQNQMRVFEFRKCVLEGNYTRAGAVWEQVHGNGRFPKLREEDKAKLSVLLPSFRPETAGAAVVGGSALVPVGRPPETDPLFRAFARQPALPILDAIQNESNYRHTRGLLFLIEGQMGEARKQLAAAPVSQGVTTIPWGMARLDEQYVRMIDAAAK